MATLKVYGWTGMTPIPATYPRSNSRQSRFVVAAHSVAEVLRVAKISRSDYAWSGCETGNAEEIEIAMAEPLTVFHCALDDLHRTRAVWERLTW